MHVILCLFISMIFIIWMIKIGLDMGHREALINRYDSLHESYKKALIEMSEDQSQENKTHVLYLGRELITCSLEIRSMDPQAVQIFEETTLNNDLKVYLD